MKKSAWKFAFVDPSVLRHFMARYLSPLVAKKKQLPIKVWAKSSTILSIFVGYSFLIYNGKKFVPLVVTPNMVGFKFGQYAITKKIGSTIHTQNKVKKKLKRKLRVKKRRTNK